VSRSRRRGRGRSMTWGELGNQKSEIRNMKVRRSETRESLSALFIFLISDFIFRVFRRLCRSAPWCLSGNQCRKYRLYRSPNQYLYRQFLVLVLVRRFLPQEELGVVLAQLVEDGDGGPERQEAFAIGDVELRAAAELPREFVEGGLEVRLTEVHAGQAFLVQLGAEIARVYPRRAEELEGLGG